MIDQSGETSDGGPAGEGAAGQAGSRDGAILCPTPEEIAQEAARYRRVQRAVQVSLALIYQTEELSLGQSIEIVVAAKSIALDLFPGSGETFDLIYRPRLVRAISERFGIKEMPEAPEQS